MSRGKKLDIFIGANIEDGWAEVQTPKKNSSSNEIKEPAKHLLVFKKEKRRGKAVTLVGEFHVSKDDAQALLKTLKKKLACGGSFKEGWMEFQGDIQEKLKEHLLNEGYRFKH